MSLTEGHDPGTASQECSRHDQDRPGAVSLLGQGEDGFTVAAWSSPGDKPSPTAGGEPSGDIHGPELLLQQLGMDLGTQHQQAQPGRVRRLSSGWRRADCNSCQLEPRFGNEVSTSSDSSSSLPVFPEYSFIRFLLPTLPKLLLSTGHCSFIHSNLLVRSLSLSHLAVSGTLPLLEILPSVGIWIHTAQWNFVKMEVSSVLSESVATGHVKWALRCG